MEPLGLGCCLDVWSFPNVLLLLVILGTAELFLRACVHGVGFPTRPFLQQTTLAFTCLVYVHSVSSHHNLIGGGDLFIPILQM